MPELKASSSLENLPDYTHEQEAIGQKTQTCDLASLQSQILPGLDGHEWRQQGPYLICHSCPRPHGLYVGLDKMLKTTKNKRELVLERVKPLDASLKT